MNFNNFSKIDLSYAYMIIFIILCISMWYHTFIYDDCDVNPTKEKKYIDYINTSHSGLMRGLVFGIILGDTGIQTGIKNAAIYGIINPLFLYYGY